MSQDTRRRLKSAATYAADVEWGGYAVRDAILSQLASVYADHPDHREEWRP